MSFNDQVNNLTVGGGRRGIFREGIKSKSFAGDAAILFRIQPAYNYEDKDPNTGAINPCGWLPCRTPDGDLTPWGGIIKVCRFVGHGHGKASNRRDFLSPWTFGKPDTTFCPLNTLYVTASNYPEWQYLLEDRKDASGRLVERGALSQPSEQLVINAVELSGGAMPENILGLLSKSACDSLVSKHKNGLLFQRANNVTDEDIARNPLSAWAIGDVTHPLNGPVLYVNKAPDGKGKMASYMVGLATDVNQRVRRFPLDAQLMMRRFDLSDLHNVIEPRSDEETVNDLVKIFCMRGPQGYHEYTLLKLAFGDFFKIPDPPAAPAASSTVATGGYGPQAGYPQQGGGFGANPAGGQPGVPGIPGVGPQDAPQYGQAPAQGIPQGGGFSPAQGGFAPPAQGGFGPGQGIPQGGGFAPGQGAPQAQGGFGPGQAIPQGGAQPGGFGGPAGPVGPRPGAPVGPQSSGPVGPVGPRPGAQPQGAPAVAQPSQAAPGLGNVAAAAQGGVQQPAGAMPQVPGDAVPPFNPQGFLTDLRQPQGGPAQPR